MWRQYEEVVRPFCVDQFSASEAEGIDPTFFLTPNGSSIRTDRYLRLITERLSHGEFSLTATDLRKIEASATAGAPGADHTILVRNRAHTDATSRAYYELQSSEVNAQQALKARRRLLGSGLAPSQEIVETEASGSEEPPRKRPRRPADRRHAPNVHGEDGEEEEEGSYVSDSQGGEE